MKEGVAVHIAVITPKAMWLQKSTAESCECLAHSDWQKRKSHDVMSYMVIKENGTITGNTLQCMKKK